MVYKGVRLSDKQRKLVVNLHRQKYSYRKIALKTGISKSSVFRAVQNNLAPHNKKKKKMGRPDILNVNDKRKLEEAVAKLKEENAKYTIKKVVETSGVCLTAASRRTFARFIHKVDMKFNNVHKNELSNIKGDSTQEVRQNKLRTSPRLNR